MSEVRVRRGTSDDTDAFLTVLAAAYSSTSFTHEWHRWKHVECPLGSSRSYIAEDDTGILGVFFALPWRYRAGSSQIVGVRLVDGAVLPAARGKRVLGLIVRQELDAWNAATRPAILLATATPAAQKSHALNGAFTLDPIRSAYGVATSFRPARLSVGDHVLDSYEPDTSGPITTDWTPGSLRWRIDPRSGRNYEAAQLGNGDRANGLVYRVDKRGGLRTLLPIVAWGSDRERRLLLGSVVRKTRSVAVLAPVGPGAQPSGIRQIRQSGASVMCVWDKRAPDGPDFESANDARSWAMSMGDLEGLI